MKAKKEANKETSSKETTWTQPLLTKHGQLHEVTGKSAEIISGDVQQ